MLHAMTWADTQSLASLRDFPPGQPEALPLYGHVLAAEEVWLARLESREPRCAVWPTLAISECETLAAENARGYQKYLENLTESDLAALVRYRNSRGEEFASSALDILTHVVIHGAYHRGQIARIIGRGGGQAPNTDFIIFARSVEKAHA
jgi:uncharacterized damage-inducible protein DinB